MTIPQGGFTLIEILVALAIGMLIIGAAYSYFLSTLRNSSAMVAQSRLQQEIRTAADLMQRDLRRAGYFPNGDTTNQPLVSTIWIGKTTSAQANTNCVIYRYVDERGTLRNGGFLLAADGRLYMKNAGSSNNTCQTGSDWVAITASNFTTVSRFTVSYTSGSRPRLAIGLTGTLQSDSKVNFALDQTITLFNAPSLGTATTGS
ncbi:PilW family protein [Chitinilyticum piscinae]|uniref:Prepilin-type N-terminal cleavage/methylation domain-containing protein n=1 Tax=Chitinilyticum piscinae TaxID=2866724 RepID=A0A8J7KC05_9NEIS|nr:prepilin-type N-terminal cleavage/methylation domain-containing protein [Chitinilyticum piscinae]MBE9610789.1 prepilin-type N-terminal cleavage/methylation domain-containing protein [Chitinilyticum piscinae]